MRRPPIHASCNSASGTRVVLPAPGGACSTAWRPCASASRRGGRQTSTGKGGAFERAEDMMRIVSWRLLRGALSKLFCSAGRARASRLFTDAPYIDEFVLFVELDLEQTVYPCMCDEALQHLRRKLHSAAVEGLGRGGLRLAFVIIEIQLRRHREPEAQARTCGRGHERASDRMRPATRDVGVLSRNRCPRVGWGKHSSA